MTDGFEMINWVGDPPAPEEGTNNARVAVIEGVLSIYYRDEWRSFEEAQKMILEDEDGD